MYRSARNASSGKTRIGNWKTATSETCRSESRSVGNGTGQSKQFFEMFPYGFLRGVLRIWGIEA